MDFIHDYWGDTDLVQPRLLRRTELETTANDIPQNFSLDEDSFLQANWDNIIPEISYLDSFAPQNSLSPRLGSQVPVMDVFIYRTEDPEITIPRDLPIENLSSSAISTSKDPTKTENRPTTSANTESSGHPPPEISEPVNDGNNLDGQPFETQALSRGKHYICPECGFKTRSDRTYGEHMLAQHKIKPFLCDSCPTRVSRKDNLKSHQRTCKSKSTATSSQSKRQPKRRVCLNDIKSSRDPSVSSEGTDRPLTSAASPNILTSSPKRKADCALSTDQEITDEPSGRLIARIAALEQECTRLRESSIQLQKRLKYAEKDREDMERDRDDAREIRDKLYERCKKYESRMRRRPEEEEVMRFEEGFE